MKEGIEKKLHLLQRKERRCEMCLQKWYESIFNKNLLFIIPS